MQKTFLTFLFGSRFAASAMSSKRVKLPADACQVAEQKPPAALTAQCFDILLQAPRKQQLQLLASALPACSPAALDAVWREAQKLGLIINTQSRFQTCSNRLLDACFSFLDFTSLRAAETVCTRWRSACIDNSSAWGSVLASIPVVCCDWRREFHRHRLSADSVGTIAAAAPFSRADLLLLRQLSVGKLKLHDEALVLPAVQVLSNVTALEISQLRKFSVTHQFIDKLRTSAMALCLTELDVELALTPRHLVAVSRLPNLRALKFFADSASNYLASGLDFPALELLGLRGVTLNCLAGFIGNETLRSLSVSGSISSQVLQAIVIMTQLTTVSCYAHSDDMGDLSSLAAMTQLTSLSLNASLCVQRFRIAADCLSSSE